ncbi:MAG: TylF/MycF/NovP-related O-methyltransferase [Planctomycetota bacterium]
MSAPTRLPTSDGLIEEIFQKYDYPVGDKLRNFDKFVSQTFLARFLARYELFKKILGVKGSIVECGVRHGGGLLAWAKLAALLEPFGFNRRIIGFDTFAGFPGLREEDRSPAATGNENLRKGGFALEYDVYGELTELLKAYDGGRILNQYRKVELVRGDACETIPRYLGANRHLLVALLFLDFDIYEPTSTALECLLPRMPKGSLIVFDELNCPDWPGETIAMLENLDLNQHKIEKFTFEGNISYIEL